FAVLALESEPVDPRL
ncbi:MAG: hypothetical protein H6856_09650, partial [Rhodospirillales bacterium]|nr:hypothetical protein [Rhodospirillales bacterium]